MHISAISHIYNYNEYYKQHTYIPVMGDFSLYVSASGPSNPCDLGASPPTLMDSRVSYFSLNSIVSLPYDFLALLILVKSATIKHIYNL